jgi:hypothetical protein
LIIAVDFAPLFFVGEVVIVGELMIGVVACGFTVGTFVGGIVFFGTWTALVGGGEIVAQAWINTDKEIINNSSLIKSENFEDLMLCIIK